MLRNSDCLQQSEVTLLSCLPKRRSVRRRHQLALFPILAAMLIAAGTACGNVQRNDCRDYSVCENVRGSGPQTAFSPASASSAAPAGTADALPGSSSEPSATSNLGEAESPTSLDRDPGFAAATAPPPQSTPTQIALTQLCNTPHAHCLATYSGTIPVGNQTFSYSVHTECCPEPPEWDQAVNFPENTCTSIYIQFAVKGSGTAYLQLMQGSNPKVSKSTTGAVGILTAALDGSPFILEADSSDGSWVFLNGYAICITDSGTA